MTIGQRQIYILGAGGIGTLISSQLCQKYGVNFFIRSAHKIDHLKQNNNKITIQQAFNNNKIIDYNISNSLTVDSFIKSNSNNPDFYIEFLFVCVKTFDTIKALKPLLNWIKPNKTKIILVQNGMGVVEELYSKFWPNLESRPILYQGVISHGVYQNLSDSIDNPFKFIHAGFADFKICKVPKDLNKPESNIESDKEANDEIIDYLVENAELATSYHNYKDLLVYQVEKLMVNACINPNTAIVDCVNGELGNIESVKSLFTEIISESINVLSKSLPILKESKIYKEKFDDQEKLVNYVLDCGTILNGKNSSSMRQDVLNNRGIEIDYINGFIVSQAESIGLIAPVNKTIQLLAKTKLQISLNRLNN